MREIAARFTNCGYCDRPLKKDLSNVHIDHFVPYRLGGQNIASNIIICCQYCNHAKHSHEFYSWAMDYFGHYSRDLPAIVIRRVESYFKKYY
ncbi:HNH endonuclease [Bacillus wiedmannii]|uniref:HNH endonuclease n=1 Tax=Bacillus wiedmannii TaxID=1890302 RepID=UPI003B9833E7